MKKEKGKETNSEGKKDKEKKKREVSAFREYFELITEVVIFVFFINAFLLQTYVIPSSSMEETMLVGDHLLVGKVAYSNSLGSFDRIFLPQSGIERGMIVTFSGPSEINRGMEPKNLVKRVIALPGDTIRIDRDLVYINGQLQDEPYKVFKDRPPLGVFPPDNAYRWHHEFPLEFRASVVDTANGKAFLVPVQHYFCMGDNRNHSFDSRAWGPVPAQYIIGKPWRVYWSYEATSREYQISGLWNKVKDFFKTVAHFFTKTRWERTFKKY
ncbi:MAG: signal peptidase I [bacterium]|nr:signal peptidase I [bacterium]